MKRLTLRYAKVGVTASIHAEAMPTHLSFELVALEPAGRANLALWGFLWRPPNTSPTAWATN